jgi:hypothetical protein
LHLLCFLLVRVCMVVNFNKISGIHRFLVIIMSEHVFCKKKRNGEVLIIWLQWRKSCTYRFLYLGVFTTYTTPIIFVNWATVPIRSHPYRSIVKTINYELYKICKPDKLPFHPFRSIHYGNGNLAECQKNSAKPPRHLAVNPHMAKIFVGEDGLRKSRPRPARLTISVRAQFRSRGEVFAIWVWRKR